jgi:hypothetical protein
MIHATIKAIGLTGGDTSEPQASDGASAASGAPDAPPVVPPAALGAPDAPPVVPPVASGAPDAPPATAPPATDIAELTAPVVRPTQVLQAVIEPPATADAETHLAHTKRMFEATKQALTIALRERDEYFSRLAMTEESYRKVVFDQGNVKLDFQAKITRLQRDIQFLSEEKNNLKEQLQEKMTAIRIKDDHIASLSAKVRTLEKEPALLNRQLRDVQVDLAKCQEELHDVTQTRDKLQTRLSEMTMSSRAASKPSGESSRSEFFKPIEAFRLEPQGLLAKQSDSLLDKPRNANDLTSMLRGMGRATDKHKPETPEIFFPKDDDDVFITREDTWETPTARRHTRNSRAPREYTWEPPIPTREYTWEPPTVSHLPGEYGYSPIDNYVPNTPSMDELLKDLQRKVDAKLYGHH